MHMCPTDELHEEHARSEEQHDAACHTEPNQGRFEQTGQKRLFSRLDTVFRLHLSPQNASSVGRRRGSSSHLPLAGRGHLSNSKALQTHQPRRSSCSSSWTERIQGHAHSANA
eukprot:6200381-Pleurochrysis_carterae.AAC.1